MTFHRFAYKVCWKNRVIVPLVLLLCTILLLVILLRDTSIEFHPGGRIRVKYYVPATLPPQEPSKDVVRREVFKTVFQQQQDVFEPVEQVESRHPGSEEVRIIRVKDKDYMQIADELELSSEHTDGRSYLRWKGVRNDHAYQNVPNDGSKQALESNEELGAVNNLLNKHQRMQDSVLLHMPKEKQSIPDAKNPSNNWMSNNQNGTRIRLKKEKRKFKSRLKFKPVWRKTLYYNVSDPPEIFNTWRMYKEKFCDGRFIGYFNEFAVLKNVKVDRKFCVSNRKGGEKIESVLNQPEEAEYFTYDVGCFQQECSERPSYYFNNNNHINDWLYSLKTHSVDMDNYDMVQKNFVIAVVRYEYVNIYHTMSDWYNAFLMMQFFNKTQWDTNIILVDTHPQGSLDATWLALFNTTRRMSALPNRTLFTDMVWNIIGYNSPLLDHYGPALPLAEEFRDFFLTSFNIPDNHKLNCQELTIMFIWRRDYLAHPRNPGGSISRKVENERELMKTVQEKYPNHRVRGVQIDLFEMQKQLNLATTTDILIGMHGAGLTHALFLPKHAGLIELIPNYWSAANDHFYAIAQWRHLVYERWINEDPHNEVHDNFTKVPTGVILALVKSVIKGICGNS